MLFHFVILLFVATSAHTVTSQSTDETVETIDTVIGIDLGTTYTCVGVVVNGKVQIIPNEQGNRITPSYVSWHGWERFIGDSAKNQATSNPNNTVFDVKRIIGRKFSDEHVQDFIKTVPYTILSRYGKPVIEVTVNEKQRQFAPEEISAMMLNRYYIYFIINHNTILSYNGLTMVSFCQDEGNS